MTRPAGWVERRLGLRLHDDGTGDLALADLVAVALRRNPKRAHLLVSGVLGKHVPAPPSEVCAAGDRVGAAVRARLGTAPAGLVLGFAETATALGHLVAAGLDATYLHSTRRTVPGVPARACFDEPHSHATDHRLLPDGDPLTTPGAVVLVDDEVSTGRTALNTIAALHRIHPRERYVLATLVDVRSEADRAECAAAAAHLGVRFDVVALASGRVVRPAGFDTAAAPLAAASRSATSRAGTAAPTRHEVRWPAGVPEGARHGCGPDQLAAVRDAAVALGRSVSDGVAGPDVLVLGHEEFMYVPLLVAGALQERLGAGVRFSSTTRSPVVVVDEAGYPIRTALRFASSDAPADGAGPRYAYNVAAPEGARRFSDIVVVLDGDADTDPAHAPDGLLAQVAGACERAHLVVVPTHRPALVAAP